MLGGAAGAVGGRRETMPTFAGVVLDGHATDLVDTSLLSHVGNVLEGHVGWEGLVENVCHGEERKGLNGRWSLSRLGQGRGGRWSTRKSWTNLSSARLGSSDRSCDMYMFAPRPHLTTFFYGLPPHFHLARLGTQILAGEVVV